MTWKFGKSLKPTNQEAMKLKTNKPRNFSSKGSPSTPQLTDSHPCTRPPSWGTRGNMGDKTFGSFRNKHRDALMHHASRELMVRDALWAPTNTKYPFHVLTSDTL